MPLCFEDVEVGDELPPIVREPITYTQLVTYCGIAGVSDPVHFDPDAARAAGFPDIIANGALRVGFLCQLICNWVLPEGDLKRITCQHRGPVVRGDRVTTRGRVTGKFLEGDAACVECEIWNETPRGGQTDVGTAVVTLPRRGQQL